MKTYQDYEYRNDILKKIADILNNMTNKHNKILPFRCDLRFPSKYEHDGGNTEIRRLHKNFDAQMRKKGVDFAYVTVREQNESNVPHYHMFGVLDGNKVDNPYAAQRPINDGWKRIVRSEEDGLVDYCRHKPGHPIPPMKMIRRPSSLATGEKLQQQTEDYERTIDITKQHASYLAKTYTKGRADGSRELMSSQLKT